MSVFTVPTIVIITYSLMEIIKHFIFKRNEKYYKFIPLMAAACGLILGIVGFYCIPSWFMPSDLFQAILVGIFSGLSATGTNQIIKQFRKEPLVKEIEKNLFGDDAGNGTNKDASTTGTTGSTGITGSTGTTNKTNGTGNK